MKLKKRIKSNIMLACMLTTLIICLIIIAIGLTYFTRSEVALKFTDSGGTIVVRGSRPTAAQFLLSANHCWVDTGIEIPPNSAVRFTTSGEVHLAIHQLVEAGVVDRRPVFEWSSPDGLDYQVKRSTDILRRDFLIEPKARIGKVLGSLQYAGDEDPGIYNRRPENLFVLNDQLPEIRNRRDEKAILWLTVNDILLDPNNLPESKSAYLEVYNKEDSTYKYKEETWEYIVNEQYWDIWFDDNIGNYLIQMVFSSD